MNRRFIGDVRCGQDENQMVSSIACVARTPSPFKTLRMSRIFSCLFSEIFWDSHRRAWLCVLNEASLDIYYVRLQKSQILVIFTGLMCDWLHGT